MTSDAPRELAGTAPHRCGVVALLGRPNAGKSTLLNRLLGEKIAAVTPKPQTTRSQLLGIVTRDDAQILLLDTPGLHEGSKPLDVAMRDAATRASEDCDVALLLVDPARGLRSRSTPSVSRASRSAACRSSWSPRRSIAPACAKAPWPPPEAAAAAATPRISARSGEGVEALLAAVVARLPEGPPHFPADQLTDRPMRFVAAEFVREAAFLELSQELPYRLGGRRHRIRRKGPEAHADPGQLAGGTRLAEEDRDRDGRRAGARDRFAGASRPRAAARPPGLPGAAREGRPGLGKAGEALEITRVSVTPSRPSAN